METIKAISTAITVGMLLVIIMYLSYLMIPIIIIAGVVSVVFLFSKPRDKPPCGDPPITVNW